MSKKSLQVVDVKRRDSPGPSPSIKMTERMPGPVSRQRPSSMSIGMETIREKRRSPSPPSSSADESSDADVSSATMRAPPSSAPPSAWPAKPKRAEEGGSGIKLRTTRLEPEPKPGPGLHVDIASDDSSSGDEAGFDVKAGLKVKGKTASWASDVEPEPGLHVDIASDDSSSGDEAGFDVKVGLKVKGKTASWASDVEDESEKEVVKKDVLVQVSARKPGQQKKATKKSPLRDEDIFKLSDDDDDESDIRDQIDVADADAGMDAARRNVESQDDNLHIRLQQGRGRHHLTLLEGLGEEYDHKLLLKELKVTFACNGKVNKAEKTGDHVIVLQGNQCTVLREFLIKEDVPPNKIRMHNF